MTLATARLLGQQKTPAHSRPARECRRMDERAHVVATRASGSGGLVPVGIDHTRGQADVMERKFIKSDSDLATSACAVAALMRDKATPHKAPDDRG